MDFLLPENGHIDYDDGDYHLKDLRDERMIRHAPLLICNYDPEILSNERQFGRIFPDTNFENVLDPRYCDVGRCHQDLRKEKFCDKKIVKAPDFSNNLVNNVVNNANNVANNGANNVQGVVLDEVFNQPNTLPNNNVNPVNIVNNVNNVNQQVDVPFTSGKADPRLYFAAIDTESKLKRIDYSDNLCYVKNYISQDTPAGGDKEVFDKDYRTPIRIFGRMECGNLSVPKQNPETKNYYFPQDFMRADQIQNTMFYNNTRRKTMNHW
tara:strand:+ start:84 stop:881 length:798 start_codon:yes stop_codon:yes gene_type:complete